MTKRKKIRMDEHRVPMLGGALRRRSDPMHSADPRVRELVGALAGLEIAPAPRPEFRAELRAQLVAVTPRLVAEGEPAVPAPAGQRLVAAQKQAHEQDDAPRRRRLVLDRRVLKPLIAAACVLTAFVVLLGGAVLISQHALPGDALYGIKRASENTEYSLAGGAVDKGTLKLEFAARRIGEVGALLPRATALPAGTGALADSGAINSDTAGLVRDTLGSADGDIQTAAQLLGSSAVQSGKPAALDDITSWTPGQTAAMRAILLRIPAGALHRRAAGTLHLLQAAQQRATALRSELGCSCLGSTDSDQLGPVPCSGPCSAPAVNRPHHPGTTRSTSPRATPPARSGHPVVPGTTSTTTSSPGAPAPTSAAAPGTSTAPAPGKHTTSGGARSSAPPRAVTSPNLPGLPTPTVPGLGGPSGSGKNTHLPISVTSTCVRISAGPINIGVGGC